MAQKDDPTAGKPAEDAGPPNESTPPSAQSSRALERHAAIQTIISATSVVLTAGLTAAAVTIALLQWQASERQVQLDYARSQNQYSMNVRSVGASGVKGNITEQQFIPYEMKWELTPGDGAVRSVALFQNVIASYTDEFHAGGTDSCKLFLGSFYQDAENGAYAPVLDQYNRLHSFPKFKAREGERRFQISAGPTVAHVAYVDVFGDEKYDRITYATEWDLRVERSVIPAKSNSPSTSYLWLSENGRKLDTPVIYTRSTLDPACYEMFEVRDLDPQYLNR